MNIIKQHIVLSLIRSGRYKLDPATGSVISSIGKQLRKLVPTKLYTGYLEYKLDIGFNETITVYGQGFSYLATYLTTYNPKFVIDHIDKNKANNKPSNLRCITQSENNHSNFKNRGGGKRTRLPIDQKMMLKSDWESGFSFVKLAEKYNITRQTASRLCQ